jgi:hypothetical protein
LIPALHRAGSSQSIDERVLERLSLALVGVWTLVAVAIHFAREPIVITPDSASFMHAADKILGGNPVDVARTPGYPALLALVHGNPEAATAVQGILCVAAAVGVAFLGQKATGRWWVGLVTGGAFAISWAPVHYARTIGSEALSIPLFVGLACLMVMFDGRRVMVGSVVVALLAFTRLEFIAIPAVLAGLVWFAHPSRRTLYAAFGAAAAIFASLFAYALTNGVMNDYYGLSVVSRINRLGKIMEYRMQGDAPSRYDDITTQLDAYLRQPASYHGPYVFASRMPELQADNWRLAGEYGTATMRAAPLEFAQKTARELGRHGWFVAIAICWIALWAVRGGTTPRAVGILSLLVLYDLAMTSLGGYESFDRLQAPAYPLMLVVTVVSLLAGANVVIRRLERGDVRVWRAAHRRVETQRQGTVPDES